MTPRPIPVGLCAVVLVAGCSSALRSADRAFEAGDVVRATAGYEAELARRPTGRGAERALFRVAVAHALPSSPLYDAVRAQELLGEVVARFPAGPYADQARVIQPLVTRLGELQDELKREKAEETALRATADDSAARLRDLEAAGQGKDEELARLRTSFAETRERLRRIETELEALKRIDFQRHP